MSSQDTALTTKEIRKAARAAITTLDTYNLNACLFGSLACAIWGMKDREPNDADIIVLTADYDPEEIKDLIVSSNDKFFLVPSANPNNTYRVLWFALWAPRGAERSCKVDILIPGLLSIPNIPTKRLVYVEPFQDIPVVPLLPLLLLKLRGWTDHLADTRRRMQEKVEVDEGDIDELLTMAVEDYECHLKKERWMPRWFIKEAKERVQMYITEWPESEEQWEALGF